MHTVYMQCIYIYTVFWAGNSPNIRCIYTAMANPTYVYAGAHVSTLILTQLHTHTLVDEA